MTKTKKAKKQTEVFAKDAEQILETKPVVTEVPVIDENLELLLEAVNRGELIGSTSRAKLVKAGLLKG